MISRMAIFNLLAFWSVLNVDVGRAPIVWYVSRRGRQGLELGAGQRQFARSGGRSSNSDTVLYCTGTVLHTRLGSGSGVCTGRRRRRRRRPVLNRNRSLQLIAFARQALLARPR